MLLMQKIFISFNAKQKKVYDMHEDDKNKKEL